MERAASFSVEMLGMRNILFYCVLLNIAAMNLKLYKYIIVDSLLCRWWLSPKMGLIQYLFQAKLTNQTVIFAELPQQQHCHITKQIYLWTGICTGLGGQSLWAWDQKTCSMDRYVLYSSPCIHMLCTMFSFASIHPLDRTWWGFLLLHLCLYTYVTPSIII